MILYHHDTVTVSYRAKLLGSHAAVALVVGIVTLVVVERQVSRGMEQQLDHRLEAQARAVADWLQKAAHPGQLSRRLAGVVDARVTILDAHGIAIGESQLGANPRPGMDSEGNPVEVQAARTSGVGHDTRFSPVDGEQVRYIAVSAPGDSVVRLGVPLGEIDATRAELRRNLIVAAIASLVLALGLAALVVGPLTRRIREATAFARRIGDADYQLPAPPASRDEIGVLSTTLATAGAELRATERKRRAFLATVAHEIRTPVTSIRGYAKILAGPDVDPATQREFLDTIHRNAIRIGTLVDDLLELEALDARAGAPLGREPVVVAPVIAHAVETLRMARDDAGATIAVDAAGDIRMLGDSDAIERIVLNLVDNALRHGGRGVRVEVSAQRAGDRARIVVADNGPGIADDHRGHVFDRFHRATTGAAGSGLGLAIARELAVAMDGTLVLSGASTFTLELPA